MTSGSPDIRQLVRQVLVQDAGSDANRAAVATAVVHVYERLALLVTPLIGAPGVNALMARSVRLTQLEFPWLDPSRNNRYSESSVTQLRVDLMRQEPAVALDAAAAVLAMFGGLLATFIGESVATRLIRKAWPGGFADEGTEETRS